MNWQNVIPEGENLKSKSSQIHGIERIEPKRMSNQKVIKLLVYQFYLIDFPKSWGYTVAEEAWVQGEFFLDQA